MAVRRCRLDSAGRRPLGGFAAGMAAMLRECVAGNGAVGIVMVCLAVSGHLQKGTSTFAFWPHTSIILGHRRGKLPVSPTMRPPDRADSTVPFKPAHLSAQHHTLARFLSSRPLKGAISNFASLWIPIIIDIPAILQHGGCPRYTRGIGRWTNPSANDGTIGPGLQQV